MSVWNGRKPPKTVLVTGGAGFVGTNLSHRLASRGIRVLVYDDLSRPGVEENLRWLVARHGDRVEVEVASVTDRLRLERAVRRAGAVFHCAAQVAVTTSFRDPRDDFAVNTRGTLNLLEAMRSLPEPPPLVFTSTNKVYGPLDGLELEEGETAYRPRRPDDRSGIPEDQPLAFQSPYGCSKGAADQYVLEYARTFGIPATVFRMSCIYGPHQHGTEDQGWLAHFALRVRRGRPITVFGDGKQVRDILHVDDLVDAFLRALGHRDRVAGRAFNIGGGPDNAVSLLEALELLDRLSPDPPEIGFEDWRPGDQRWYVSDTRRFRQATGWEPRVGKHEGIRRLHTWMAERAGGASERAAKAGVR